MNASWWNIHPFVFTQSLFSFQGTTLWRVLPFRKVVGSSGLEPPTSRLSGARSNHLSYEPIQFPRCISSLIPTRRFRLRQLAAGGDDGNRTHDPLLAGQVLSQLSYTPVPEDWLVRSRFPLLVKVLFREPSKSNRNYKLKPLVKKSKC